MADEYPNTAPPEVPQAVTETPESVSAVEKEMLDSVSAVEKEMLDSVSAPPPPPAAKSDTVSDPPVKSFPTLEEVIEPEKPKSIDSHKIPESLISFKEESNRVGDLSVFEKKALDEFKQLVQEALNNNHFTTPPPPPLPSASTVGEKHVSAHETPQPTTTQETLAVSTEPASDTLPPPSETETPITVAQIVKEISPSHDSKAEITSLPEEASIWGVPLLKDDRSDVILLKFLRARDFKVKDAFAMLWGTVRWRKEFGIDALVDEDLGDDLEKVVFMHCFDKEGHPVCYNVYGEFQNRELYQKTFADEEKRMKFLRWRIQFLERGIRKLDFNPGGICSIFQVSDLKNSPGPAKRELRLATKQALQLLQDNYPEFVAKQVFINVPWWYLAFYTMISPFLTQRTKSKFVFAGPTKTAETLFKYIPPEQVPIQYGGLSVDLCECNPEFTIDDPATEVTIKPATKQTVEIIVNEKCIIVWELRVVGWEVSYSSEYVPSAEGAYTLMIQKATKMAPTDEPVVCDYFKISELGKIVLTIDNPTSKKKKLLYRFKVKSFCD